MSSKPASWQLACERPDLVYNAFAAMMENLPMTQRDLAEQTGVTESTVSRWAAKKTKPGFIRMAEALEVVNNHLGAAQGAWRFAQQAWNAAAVCKNLYEEVLNGDEAAAERLHGRREDLRRIGMEVERLRRDPIGWAYSRELMAGFSRVKASMSATPDADPEST